MFRLFLLVVSFSSLKSLVGRIDRPHDNSRLSLEDIVRLHKLNADAWRAQHQETQWAGRKLKDSGGTKSGMRIFVEFQGSNFLSPEEEKMAKSVTLSAAEVIKRHLMIRSTSQSTLLVPPLCLSPSPNKSIPLEMCSSWYPDVMSTPEPINTQWKCGLASINPHHVMDPRTCGSRSSEKCRAVSGGKGVATDFYLYVTTVSTSDCTAGAVASSQKPCLFDRETNRPLMGSINLCPKILDLNSNAENLLNIVIHELIHSLGFMDALFPLFINGDGSPVSQVVVPAEFGGQIINRVATPNVVHEVRQHFGCPTLDGAQLETLGGPGSSGSHWEYTWFQGELMVSSTIFSADGEAARISRLTIALLEDSGWYLGNWTSAAPLTWAKGAGCRFVTQNCIEYMATNPDNNLFCNPMAASTLSRGGYSCTESRKSQGTCRMLNFTGPGCGLILAREGVQSCLDTNLQYGDSEVFGWLHGPSSRCIQATYKFVAGWKDRLFTFPREDVDQDAICFPMHCEQNVLFVDILGKSLLCSSGDILDLGNLLPGRYLQGTIGPCPPNNVICQGFFCPNCTSGGDCIEGHCVCKLAYDGSNCEHNIVTGETIQGRILGQQANPGDYLKGNANEHILIIIIVASSVGTGILLSTAVIMLFFKSLRKKAVTSNPIF